MKMKLVLVLVLATALTGCSGLFGGGGGGDEGGDDVDPATLSEACGEDPTLTACVRACDEDSTLEWCIEDECDTNPLAEGCDPCDEDPAAEGCPEYCTEHPDAEGCAAEAEVLIFDENGDVITSTTYKGDFGTPITKTFTVDGATGAVSWKVEHLPEGMTSAENGATLTLSGTPTAAGKLDEATILVSDNGSGASAEAEVTFKISETIAPAVKIAFMGLASDADPASAITVDHLQQALVIEIENRDVDADYEFKIKEGKGYSITAKPCTKGVATCRARITPKNESFVNTPLGEVTIEVENSIGNSEKITLAGVTFEDSTPKIDAGILNRDLNVIEYKDPCSEVTVVPEGSLPRSLSTMDSGASYAIDGGTGPFTWRILSNVYGATGKRLEDINASDLFDSPFEPDGDAAVPVAYTRVQDTVSDRWKAECMDDDCRKISVSGTMNYPDIYGLLGFKVGDDASVVSRKEIVKRYPGGPQFYDQVVVEVTDLGCKIDRRIEEALIIDLGSPEDEPLAGAEVAIRAEITDTFLGAQDSHARAELQDIDKNVLADTNNKNISELCGETQEFKRWNWPDFSTLAGEQKIVAIDHLLLDLDQDTSSAWDLDYTVQQFYVFGKFWYYFDDQDRHKTCSDDGDCESTIPLMKATGATGTWYLKPHSSARNIRADGEKIRLDASSSESECS